MDPNTTIKKEDMPPSGAKDKKDEGEDKLEKAIALIEKSVAQSEQKDTVIKSQQREIAMLKAQLARKAVPPKSMTEKDLPKPKDLTGDPKNHPSSEASTKAGKDTTSTEGAITSERVAKEIQEGITAGMDRLKKELREEFESMTPMPMGMAPGIQKARKDLPGLVREVIAKDREFCGSVYSSEDGGGVPAGTGDLHARELTARFLNEQFGGAL